MSDLSNTIALLSKNDRTRLGMFGPNTYAISFKQSEVSNLIKLKLVEWVPRVFGSGVDYALTELGRTVAQYVEEHP